MYQFGLYVVPDPPTGTGDVFIILDETTLQMAEVEESMTLSEDVASMTLTESEDEITITADDNEVSVSDDSEDTIIITEQPEDFC